MHNPFKRYRTPPARALMEICARVQKWGKYELTRISGGELTVNQNGLSNAMRDAKIKLPQTTITRLLNGRESKQDTLQALADFFQVDISEMRGEAPIETITPPTDDIGARLWKLWGQVPRSAKLECLEIAIRATPDGLQEITSRKKSED